VNTGLRVVGAHLGATTGEAGTGPWPRLGALAGGALLLDGWGLGRLGSSSSAAAKTSFLGLASSRAMNSSASIVSRSSRMREKRVELLAVLGEDVLRSLVRVLDHPADLVVDLAGDLVE